jgi:hypothetical protein
LRLEAYTAVEWPAFAANTPWSACGRESSPDHTLIFDPKVRTQFPSNVFK